MESGILGAGRSVGSQAASKDSCTWDKHGAGQLSSKLARGPSPVLEAGPGSTLPGWEMSEAIYFPCYN